MESKQRRRSQVGTPEMSSRTCAYILTLVAYEAAVPYVSTYDIRALVMMAESAAQLQFIALLQPRYCLQEMSQNVIFDVVSLKHCEHFMPPCHARQRHIQLTVCKWIRLEYQPYTL